MIDFEKFSLEPEESEKLPFNIMEFKVSIPTFKTKMAA